MKTRGKALFIFTFIPLIVGFCIYLFFRIDTICLFECFIFRELYEFVVHFKITSIDLPNWILNFLPDGLWIFSFTSMMIFIWHKDLTYRYLVFALIPLFLAFIFEFGQRFEIINGTYDVLDILTYILGSSLSLLINYKFNKCLTIKSLRNGKL